MYFFYLLSSIYYTWPIGVIPVLHEEFCVLDRGAKVF